MKTVEEIKKEIESLEHDNFINWDRRSHFKSQKDYEYMAMYDKAIEQNNKTTKDLRPLNGY